MALTEEAQFKSLLKEKNHKEMISVLTKILGKLDKEPPLEEVTNLLKNIADKPSDTGIPESIKAISKLIIERLDAVKEAIKDKPKKWKFSVNRGEDGLIETVSVQSN